MIFLPRFWAIIWASTRTPATAGVPTVTSAPCPTRCTLVNVTVSPTAPVSFSTSIVSPGLTRYCRPPVVITAYIPYPILSFALRNKCTSSFAVPSPQALCQARRLSSSTKVGGERITCRAERQAGPPSGPPIRRPAGPGQRQAARASPPRPPWRVALVARQAAAQDALLLDRSSGGVPLHGGV